MPDLQSYEKRVEADAEKATKKAAAKEAKRKADYERSLGAMVTRRDLYELLDRYDHTHIQTLRAEIAWLMRPLYQRWWGMAKTWLQELPGRWKAWRAKRRKAKAERVLDRKVRKMERLDAKEVEGTHSATQTDRLFDQMRKEERGDG